MNIRHPRRILAVGAPGADVARVLEDLTGSPLQPHINGSIAGVHHEWHAKTAYYEAKVPIWVDEIDDLAEWKESFLQPEAKEVVEAIGAWIYYFNVSENGNDAIARETMRAIQQISEVHAGYGADIVMLAVAVPNDAASQRTLKDDHEDWEDVCLENGFEFVNYSAKGKNEFGEQTGFARMKEALESNEWAATVHADDEDPDLDSLDRDDDDEDFSPFARDEAEMTAELFGVKADLHDTNSEPEDDSALPANESEAKIEDLDYLMGRLLAVKEQAEGLPEAQRKRLAAKAVKDLLAHGKD